MKRIPRSREVEIWREERLERMDRVLSRFAMLLCMAACASSIPSGSIPSGGAPSTSIQSSGALAPDTVYPPRMLKGGTQGHLVVPTTVAGRSSVSIAIEVLIDSTGRPDMTTLKITGFGAAENKAALMGWIEQATFSPAHLGAQPVPGVYRTKIELRV